MDKYLKEGMILNYKIDKTEGIIEKLDENYITIKYSKEINGKLKGEFPKHIIGEWLFFKEEDIDLPINELMNMPEYMYYGNEKIQEFYNSFIYSMNNECKKGKQGVKKFVLKVDELKKVYNFVGLWHFTDFTNLDKIFKAGEIYSRRYNLDNNIEFLDGANHNILEKADEFVLSCTRFYYRPKTPTLYDNEGIKPLDFQNEIHIPRPVYFLFSEELIYIMGTMFSEGNATNSKIDDKIEFFNKIDWQSVFHKGPTSDGNSRYITNKKQAELLSLNPVSLNYLKNIVFRSEADLKQAIRLWGNNDKYIVNESFFSNKDNIKINDAKYNNYITNYSINWGNDRLFIIIELKRPLNNYVLNSSVEDTKGNNMIKAIREKEVVYKDQSGNISNDRSLAKTVILTLNYKPNIGDRIKIYLNKILCIEESFGE